MHPLIQTITSADPALRDRSLESYTSGASCTDLLQACQALEDFRRRCDNLYHRVRALFFLYAIHRYHLPDKFTQRGGNIPFAGYNHLLKRRFEEAIQVALSAIGPGIGQSSALAAAYHGLAFQTLADQVRRSVRSVRGNQWMFRMGHPADHPLRLNPALKTPGSSGLYPILSEATPVRMDLSHSGWSDIFFLGMDYPEGAQVLNISIDLSVRGTNRPPAPPVEAYLRVIDRPVLRLTSVDLGASAEIERLDEVFDFARDYLGLLKAALIAAGIVPPGLEGTDQSVAELLAPLVGPGAGIELVSQVNGIPKGSRLAVSTNLLACLISVCMRATGQTRSLEGPLDEDERRLVAARAILGEWLGGSGGGWQDSGGVWPGIKLIQGVQAAEGDPEFGISRGCLLPRHRLLGDDAVSAATRQALQDSLVLVHGGMAQDVGPILEMVTEKYLLRANAETKARQQAIDLLHEVVDLLQKGDIQRLGATTHRNFSTPLQTIIPWATNSYTEHLIERVRTEFGRHFWGFWMLGGMAGGGMGFIFDPQHKQAAQERLQTIMTQTKADMEAAVPFAMEPVVYDFSINKNGTSAQLHHDAQALMPPGYYPLTVPDLLRQDSRQLSTAQRAELARFGLASRQTDGFGGAIPQLFEHLLPTLQDAEEGRQSLGHLLENNGFDALQHEQIRADLRSGRIGLAQNRLPVRSRIENVDPDDVCQAKGDLPQSWIARGRQALEAGQVAVVSLAGGAGSRWTQGAGVVKALNPFCKLAGQHRNFIEVHLAKSRHAQGLYGSALPHLITTSYLTHAPIAQALEAAANYNYPGPLLLSPGRALGLRLVPMVRDLRFAWEEMPQQLLDEQAQKMRDSLRTALIGWAQKAGEGSDYTDNLPLQCLHPVGHWYEIPNLLRNGTLAQLLAQRPQLNYLMVHNIDTLGAHLDPGILGYHIDQGAALTCEVIERCIDDRGGGLARVDGQIRLIEGLALPREEIEFDLSYYNSNTFWIDIDRLLAAFSLQRTDLDNSPKVAAAVRQMAANMPTYITLKEVKKRWGKGQEDIFPIAQFEKLWGDMTALPDLVCRYAVVARMRGQQLKEVDQLDGWLRDGSARYVEELCTWE